MGRTPEGAVVINEATGEVEETEYKSPAVTHMWPHHRKMARLAASGLRPGEIAAITGFQPGQISRILGSPLFQTELKRLEEMADEAAADIRGELASLSMLATENLEEDLRMPVETNQDRGVRQKASLGVLDRAGYSKQEEPGRASSGNLTQVNIQSMTVTELRESIFDQIQESEDD